MIIKIYDYANKCVELKVPDKEIASIIVIVLSGDETGYINFVDGSVVDFDASNTRLMDFNDGSYRVTGKDIKQWINFEPTDNRTISYMRQEKFNDGRIHYE